MDADKRAADEKEVQALQRERSQTSEKFESVESRLTHLEAMSGILLGVATLVVAILLGTIFVAEWRVKQTIADMGLKAKQAITEMEATAKEVKQRFPMLASIEEQARLALKDIEEMFVAEDWLEDRYASLAISQRQRILTVEHLIALEFSGRSTAPQLRGMANFYFSKYKSENLAADLDRALYYALMAAKRGAEGFQYLNDLGLVYTDLATRDEVYRKEAMKSLRESATKQPAHQRCYYNLAVILFPLALKDARDGRRDAAEPQFRQIQGLLGTALQHTKWELETKPGLTSLIHYNMACCLCRLAELSSATARNTRLPLLDEACTYLDTASKFKQTKRKTVYGDLLTPVDGDLFLLAHNSHYTRKVDAIIANFEKSWVG